MQVLSDRLLRVARLSESSIAERIDSESHATLVWNHEARRE